MRPGSSAERRYFTDGHLSFVCLLQPRYKTCGVTDAVKEWSCVCRGASLNPLWSAQGLVRLLSRAIKEWQGEDGITVCRWFPELIKPSFALSNKSHSFQIMYQLPVNLLLVCRLLFSYKMSFAFAFITHTMLGCTHPPSLSLNVQQTHTGDNAEASSGRDLLGPSFMRRRI